MDLTDWLAAAADSAIEIATGPLGISSTEWLGSSSAVLPEDLCGIYMPLLSDQLSLQLGILAERAVCTALAKALMGMEADEPLDSDEDVFDAVGEVANMVAGGVKVRLADKSNILVGLPLALKGKVFPAGNSTSIHGMLRIDASQLWLIVTGTSASKSAKAVKH
jgi:hypothetical protein